MRLAPNLWTWKELFQTNDLLLLVSNTFSCQKRTAKRRTAGERSGREKSSTQNLCQEIQDSGSSTLREDIGVGEAEVRQVN